MNNNITHHLPQTPVLARPWGRQSKRLPMLIAAMGTLAVTGCFRATGLTRDPMVVEVLPATGGDTVAGLKAKAGASDWYVGNDFIQVAIDSTVFGDPNRTPLAGAYSGGSIVDAGYLALDGSYNRVSMPGNNMNRLTPVVNQDPRLQVVFTQMVPSGKGQLPTLTLTGGIYDPGNLLKQGTSVSSPVVPNVAVTHSLSVAQLDRFFTVTTTVTNNSANAVPIRNIGDYLLQQGGGYHFNIPANFDYQGNALPPPTPTSRWGVTIQPGSDFTNPIATSVQAAMVGLMGTEPGADMVDSHASLGFLPVDTDRLLVASDPQDIVPVANTLRPQFPQNLVVGSLPAATDLAPGASLTFHRRLYIVGGTSVNPNLVGGLVSSGDNVSLLAPYPNQATGLFNLMDAARYNDTNLRPTQDTGFLSFTPAGSAQRQGPLPTEIRIERNITATTILPNQSPQDAVWQLQRVEWLEPNENVVTNTALAPSTLKIVLPVGTYRMVLRNQNYTQTRTLFEDLNAVQTNNNVGQLNMATPILIQKAQTFLVSPQDVLCPDVTTDDNLGNANLEGPITSNPYSAHYFTTRENNGPLGSLYPMRMTFLGANATANPVMRRQRTLASLWDPNNNVPAQAPGNIAGQYQFRGGNEMFGTGFSRYLPTTFAWLPNGGSYTAIASRGPLEDLVSLNLSTFDGQTDTSHTFSVFPLGLPPGWTSFDMPGPSQATTGGYLPGEKLASAMANGVQVVGDTEQDLQVNAPLFYWDFQHEFLNSGLNPYVIPASLSAITRPVTIPYGSDPFVIGARSSNLTGYGSVTALFTPPATSDPMGGALNSSTWTLADFLAQAQGQYNVVHRPRAPLGNPQGDPVGLFNQQGAPAASASTTWNATGFGAPWDTWWSSWSQQSGNLSFGSVNGGFDALELLRGASFDVTSQTSASQAITEQQNWFNEFLQVRNDWFALLNQQSPSVSFTKALGLSSARFSVDTPVGLARTYLLANPTVEHASPPLPSDFAGVLGALKSGAAVASTGPFLDVSVGTAGPGGLVSGPVEGVTLVVNLYKTDWMPVDELRVVVNGQVVQTINPALSATALVPAGTDPRLYSMSINLTQAQLQTVPGKDAWIVVEAGVPLTIDTTALYAPLGTPWSSIMRGIYPIAVTNPIFVNVTGGSYKPPMQ